MHEKLASASFFLYPFFFLVLILNIENKNNLKSLYIGFDPFRFKANWAGTELKMVPRGTYGVDDDSGVERSKLSSVDP